MTQNEKTISFLNNYFIYKKIRSPNAKQISKMLTGKSQAVKDEQEDTESKKSLPAKRKVKKYVKKVKLPDN